MNYLDLTDDEVERLRDIKAAIPDQEEWRRRYRRQIDDEHLREDLLYALKTGKTWRYACSKRQYSHVRPRPGVSAI